jgi:nitrogen fixation protein FixH
MSMKLFDSIFRPQEFTGRHMLGVLVLFFGTIIGVNLLLAYFASTSWSGLIVHNTYVASQHFNEEAAAEREMRARGWKSELAIDGSTFTYSLSDASGTAVAGDRVVVHFERPVSEAQDSTLDLEPVRSGVFSVEGRLNPGQWLAKIKVMDEDEAIYHESRRIVIDERGAMR